MAFITMIFPLITYLLGSKELQLALLIGLQATVTGSVSLAEHGSIVSGPPLETCQSVWRYGPKKRHGHYRHQREPLLLPRIIFNWDGQGDQALQEHDTRALALSCGRSISTTAKNVQRYCIRSQGVSACMRMWDDHRGAGGECEPDDAWGQKGKVGKGQGGQAMLQIIAKGILQTFRQLRSSGEGVRSDSGEGGWKRQRQMQHTLMYIKVPAEWTQTLEWADPRL